MVRSPPEHQHNADGQHQIEHHLSDKGCGGNVAVDDFIVAKLGTGQSGGGSVVLPGGVFLSAKATQSLKSLQNILADGDIGSVFFGKSRAALFEMMGEDVRYHGGENSHCHGNKEHQRVNAVEKE